MNMESTTNLTSAAAPNVSCNIPIPDIGTHLALMSYNSTGWGNFKANLVKTILLSHGIHIMALQEHFRLKQNISQIAKHFTDYETFCVPATKSNKTINAGRPSGGLAFIYSSKLCKFISRVLVPESSRVQGLKLTLPDFKAVFINVYFPTDPKTNNFDDSVLLKTLQDIKYLVDLCDNQYKVVVMGDLNTDFSRNTRFVQIVKQFLCDNNMFSLWDRFDMDFTYCQSQNIGGRQKLFYSSIDHFVTKYDSVDEFSAGQAIHLSANTSNHEPIFVKMKCPHNFSVTVPTQNEHREKPSLPLWNKASHSQLDQYCDKLASLVHNINVPNAIYCRNVKCCSQHHKDEIELYSTELMNAITQAVADHIPHSVPSSSNKHTIPGWNEEVKMFKEEAAFWHAVWVSAGRPENTDLHWAMKHSRNQQMYAIRRAKRNEDNIRKNKFVDACLRGEVSDVLKDLKSSRSCNSAPSGSIDGIVGGSDISKHFSSIYSKIYNTHGDNKEVSDFIEYNDSKINASDINHIDKVTPQLVKKVTMTFKPGKNDVEYLWKSDALKAGTDILATPLCNIIKAFLVHGFAPGIFLSCILVPLVKNNRASKTDSSNYRMIAISSLIMKLFDNILLELFMSVLSPSDHQFGFSKGSSTTFCTWTLLETINYYRNRGGPVYMCLLDLTKAFDLVKFSTLFKKLGERLPAVFVRLIIFSYISQECAVRWDHATTAKFNITNGVRQGAVSSPAYFNLYLDDLFPLLKQSGYGCCVGDHYYGGIAYADDVTLLAPTREGLQELINICEVFFSNLGIKISVDTNVAKSKTKCMVFPPELAITPLVLYNQPLPFVSKSEHLGHLLSDDEDTSHDLEIKRREFVAQFHSLRQELGNQSPVVYLKLIDIFLSHFYGHNLWDLNSEAAEALWRTWNTMVRDIHQLPLATHRYILEELCSAKHIKLRLFSRFTKFKQKLQDSTNNLVTNLLAVQTRDLRSTFSRNCHAADSIDINDAVYSVPENSEWIINLTREIIDIKFDAATLSEVTLPELTYILEDICCN